MSGKFFNPGGALAPGEIPIGCVVAWLKSFPSRPALPGNYVECNGQNLNDPASLFHNQPIPDLNGSASQNKFLRGAATSGGTGGTTCHTHSVVAAVSGTFCSFNTTGGS